MTGVYSIAKWLMIQNKQPKKQFLLFNFRWKWTFTKAQIKSLDNVGGRMVESMVVFGFDSLNMVAKLFKQNVWENKMSKYENGFVSNGSSSSFLIYGNM